MTPKEKAAELVGRYVQHVWLKIGYGDAPKQYKEEAKQCALIAVDEILSSHLIYFQEPQAEAFALMEEKKYWYEVKTEIEKL